jgi:ribosome-associated toxin RatA of RatAB toxin-antitoxin module
MILALILVPSFALGGQIALDEKLEAGYIIKDIQISEGSDRANVKVKTVIKSSPKAVWAALVDINNWPKWLPMNSKAYFLSDEAAGLITPQVAKDQLQVIAIGNAHPAGKETDHNSGSWQKMAYEEYNLPWPIKNEWVVRRYNYEERSDLMRASWKRVDSSRNEDDGFWEVRPWKDGGTYLVYNYKVKPKEKVPEVVFKTAVSMTVTSMIKALRHEAQKRESSSASSTANR